MVKLEFYISDENMDRLWEIKNIQRKETLSGNDFAKELLEAELRRLHPHKVKTDDEN